MSPVTLNYILQDDESEPKLETHPVVLQDGLTMAVYQAWSDYYAPLFKAVTGSLITGVTITQNLTLPAGIDTDRPVAGHFNERGGLLPFTLDGSPNSESIRIPAILQTIMPGKVFPATDTDIAAWATAITTAHSSAGTNVRPRNRWEWDYLAVKGDGKRSIHKR